MNQKILIQEFKKIQEQGWVKTTRRGTGGVGNTLEELLGITENQLMFPDYFGIEIKTRRRGANSYITLFNFSPKGKHNVEMNYLVEKYGYPDKIMKNKKVINHSTCSSYKTNLGIKYKTQLFVNRDVKVVSLLVFDRNNYLLDYSAYWKFNELYERLFDKCQYLAYVIADRKYINGIEYFKYNELSLYKLKDFSHFINAIENGKIKVTIKMGLFRKGTRMGELHNRGTGFQILEEDLKFIYKNIYDSKNIKDYVK